MFDDAIAGAGIVGLAHAYHLALRGRKVVVIERDAAAQGASIRNFGMIWPIGQSPGRHHRLALRSREIWQSVLQQSGIWHNPCGSLHLAYHEDELAVLHEFANSGHGYDCALLAPEEVTQRSSSVVEKGLKGALWSPTELCVDPRQVVADLPKWLASELGVSFRFGHSVMGYSDGTVHLGSGSLQARRLWVCPGDNLTGPWADTLTGLSLVRTKLQMMRTRTQPGGWLLGPFLAAGLTLRHYDCFGKCPSLADVKRRVARENPAFDRWGIHVMVSQNGEGEVVIGDSHVYGEEIGPFNSEEVDNLILDYLKSFVRIPESTVRQRWHGTYAKRPGMTHVVARPEKGVTIVTGLGGAGMTMSFGVAEQVVTETLGEASD